MECPLKYKWGYKLQHGQEMSILERQLRLSSLETNLEGQGWDGIDMCRGWIVDMLDKGC